MRIIGRYYDTMYLKLMDVPLSGTLKSMRTMVLVMTRLRRMSWLVGMYVSFLTVSTLSRKLKAFAHIPNMYHKTTPSC